MSSVHFSDSPIFLDPKGGLEIEGDAVSRGEDGRYALILKPVLTLGRGDAADVRIQDRGTSRLHAELAFDSVLGQWKLKDLGSANGTVLNGKRVQKALLSNGDTITMGTAVLTFVIEEAEPEDETVFLDRETDNDADDDATVMAAGSTADLVADQTIAADAVPEPEPEPEAKPETEPKSGSVRPASPVAAEAGSSATATRAGTLSEPEKPEPKRGGLSAMGVAVVIAILAAGGGGAGYLMLAEPSAEQSVEAGSSNGSAAPESPPPATAPVAVQPEPPQTEAEALSAAPPVASTALPAAQSQVADEIEPVAPALEADPQPTVRSISDFSREEIRKIQSFLKDFGFYDGGIDGLWGSGSQAALSQFQESIGEPSAAGLSPNIEGLINDHLEQTAEAAKAAQALKIAAEKAAAEKAAAQKAAAEKAAAEKAAAQKAAAEKAAAQKAAAQKAAAQKAAEAKAAAERAAADRRAEEEAAAQQSAAEAAAKEAAKRAAEEAASQQRVQEVAPKAPEADPKVASLTGRQILDEVADRHDQPFEYEVQKMVLIDKSGSTEEREMRRYSREVGDEENRYLSIFTRPSGVRGVALLTWKHKEADDDQWLYLPAQGSRMKRIAKGGRRNYFMGTDYTYEDLVSEPRRKFRYERGADEVIDGHTYFVVKVIPTDPVLLEESGYAFRIMWIRQDIFFIYRTDFYDRRERLIKRQISSDLKVVKAPMWRAGRNVMENLKTGHKTDTLVKERTFSEDSVPESAFRQQTITSGRLVR
ncbi:MAG: outer membrane lipoprotein-sorting protein [Magnetovibrionaceae bacterium]